jgi:nucleoside-diphosphate-sugar epimerase
VPDVKPTVLITGANGFVGSRLCRKLVAEGFRVIAGVRKTADLRLLIDIPVEYRYGDVTQPDALPAMVTGIDYIVHNAGVVKAKSREVFFAVNEQGTRNLCEAMARHDTSVKRMVYVSSAAAAGPSHRGIPAKETDPPHPVTTYGESKLAGETVALSYAGRFPVTVVRPTGVYGPGDKEMFTLFQAVHRHLRPQVGDMSRRIQLVHVDDLCLGIFKALVAKTRSGSVYVIAEKQACTMREMIDILARTDGGWQIPLIVPAPLFRFIAAVSEYSFKLAGATPMLTREKTRELLPSWEFDVSRAKDELGYESRIPLAEGMRQTYDWYLAEGWLK